MAKLKVNNKKNSRFVFWVQLALAVVLILVMVGTISGGLLELGKGNQTISSQTLNFPPWLAGQRIQSYVTGNEAKKRMETLFDEIAVLKESWLAFYESNGVIWIGQASDETEAQRIFDKLTKRLESFVVANPGMEIKESVKKGLIIYTMKNKDLPSGDYIYRSRDKIFWVTVPAAKGEVFLNEVLDTFK